MRKTTDEERVKQANYRFYRALESLDIAEMDAVWLHADWVKCVHPGWHLISGWEDIRNSWVQIFKNTDFMRISVSDVSVRVDQELAFVVCTENITAAQGGGIASAQAQATNIFARQGSDWLLIHHHASPIPGTLSDMTSERVN